MSHIVRFSIAAILAATIVGSAHAVTIATVPVGYAGNSPDPTQDRPVGDVSYNYSIGTFDVTNAQYAEFLKAKASLSDPYELWTPLMRTANFEGAIDRTGAGPFNYTVKAGYANKPVIYVSWYDAIRFANWLSNGQGGGDTETGTYTITGGANTDRVGTVSVPVASQRAAWAATPTVHWLLPSESEWYKAAYYNGANGTYFLYPFKSDSPADEIAPPGDTNSGNFSEAAYNYDGSGSHFSDVGAYPNSVSPFGAFDMGGNAYQWNEANFGTVFGERGGDWQRGSDWSASFYDDVLDPFTYYFVGFRVASVGSVPEPSTGFLAALACGVIWLGRKRRKPSAWH